MTDDSRTIAALFREHADALYRAAFRILGDSGEAEDAVQDAFVKLRRGGRSPVDLVRPQAWLFAVLRNICIDRQRDAARRSRVPVVDLDGDDASPVDKLLVSGQIGKTPESEVLTAETLRQVSRAIDALPPIEAETLTLVVIEGLSYRDVAEITNVPIGTVRSRLNRARKALRMALHRPLADGHDASGVGPTENVIPLRRTP